MDSTKRINKDQAKQSYYLVIKIKETQILLRSNSFYRSSDVPFRALIAVKAHFASVNSTKHRT